MDRGTEVGPCTEQVLLGYLAGWFPDPCGGIGEAGRLGLYGRELP